MTRLATKWKERAKEDRVNREQIKKNQKKILEDMTREEVLLEKLRIIEIVELGQPQSLIQRENAPITELIKTDLLIEELNEQLHIANVVGQSEQLTCPRCESTNILNPDKDNDAQCIECAFIWAD